MVVLASSVARGQGASAAAEELFQQARKLLGKNQVAEACEKFAESQRLEPASGTLLNLADCHVRQGKTATAWAEFIAASNLGQQQGKRVHVEEGSRRAGELERSLSRLTIRVAQRIEGLTILRGEVPIEAGLFGKPLPVDPGKYLVAASAPGHKRWSATISVEAGGALVEIEIPALVPDEKPVPSAPPAASSGGVPGATVSPVHAPSDGPVPLLPAPPRSPVAGYVLWGVGAVALGAGAYLGWRALDTYKRAEDLCPSLKGCPREAMDRREDAGFQANVANVGFGVGLVALGVGTALVLTSGARKTTGHAWTVDPVIGAQGGGARVGGRF